MEFDHGKNFQRQIALCSRSPEQSETLYEQMHSWIRISIYCRMGGERRNIKPYFKRAWEAITLPARQSREDVEQWLIDLTTMRPVIYEVGLYSSDQEGRRSEVIDLEDRIPLGSQLRVVLHMYQYEIPEFRELFERCMTWCKSQKYTVVEQPVEIKGLKMVPREGETEAEGDAVKVKIEALNDQRMARTRMTAKKDRGDRDRGDRPRSIRPPMRTAGTKGPAQHNTRKVHKTGKKPEKGSGPRWGAKRIYRAKAQPCKDCAGTVSYTHLTLPTICSV